jgi:hypothetical protein
LEPRDLPRDDVLILDDTLSNNPDTRVTIGKAWKFETNYHAWHAPQHINMAGLSLQEGKLPVAELWIVKLNG